MASPQELADRALEKVKASAASEQTEKNRRLSDLTNSEIPRNPVNKFKRKRNIKRAIRDQKSADLLRQRTDNVVKVINNDPSRYIPLDLTYELKGGTTVSMSEPSPISFNFVKVDDKRIDSPAIIGLVMRELGPVDKRVRGEIGHILEEGVVESLRPPQSV